MGTYCSITNAFELGCDDQSVRARVFDRVSFVVSFPFYSPLRKAFLESFTDVRIRVVFAFWGWIAIATLWSPADYGLRFAEVWSWRKLLLFPMAWVLFRDPQLKRAAIFTLFVTASIYMLFSWSGTWDTFRSIGRHRDS